MSSSESFPRADVFGRRLAVIGCGLSIAGAFLFFAGRFYDSFNDRPRTEYVTVVPYRIGYRSGKPKPKPPSGPINNKAILQSMQYLHALRSNQLHIAISMTDSQMDHRTSAIAGENPIAIWSAINPQVQNPNGFVGVNIEDYRLMPTLSALLDNGAEPFLNLSVDHRGRPIDQATVSTYPFLVASHAELKIDLRPTDRHSPLLRMVRLGVGVDTCLACLRVYQKADPNWLDWIEPVTEQTVLHAACITAGRDPSFLAVINELVTDGFGIVSPNRSCFDRQPITQPAVVVETIAWSRRRIDDERQTIQPYLSFLAGPLIALVLQYVL